MDMRPKSSARFLRRKPVYLKKIKALKRPSRLIDRINLGWPGT